MTIPTEWLRQHHHAVLITLRADGSPQSSNLSYVMLGDTMKVSVTATRAKTHNLRRDPRAVLHVLGDSFWQYCSVSVTAELSAVTTEPGDAAGQELLAVYNAIADSEHPDPVEFYAAMVDEQRLVLTLTPTSAASNGLP